MHSIRIVVMVALAACSPELNTSVVVGQGSGLCPGNLCDNSNETAHHGLYKANLFGKADPYVEGGDLRLRTRDGQAQIYKEGVAYNLKVDGAELSGHSETGAIEGAQLVGAELVLERDGAYAYTIDIAAVTTRQFPLQPGSFYAYTMWWRGEKQEPTPDQPLCKPRMLDVHDKSTYPELLGLDVGETVIFAGDHFNGPDLEVEERYRPDWITFGCAGHSLAKMFLLQEVHASNPARNWAGSQATLKMLTANYCGDRNTFTIPGQPLVWIGGALHTHLTVPTALEARWDEHGATCLGTPRVRYHPSPEAELLWGPDIIETILESCPALPACTSSSVFEFDGSLRVSANRDL